ncbi:hypothetical protein PIB30_064269 [Stylosanthes scabra]|uniref:Ubiquitin-like protease family profile domain-containing protein n=1 Tax=Stylosanthes scabra TaxID=79078 RepID=A0ABU6QNN3_9FABA|nr:hypothetical protein [Stylosanthes scabra]
MQDVRRSASEAANGSDRTRIFDSFETVSLGREDSDNVVVERPSIMPSQPSQTGKSVLQAGPEAEVHPEAEVQPEVGIVVGKEQQPEPIIVEMPLQPDQPSKPQGAEVDDPGHILPLQPEQPSTPQYNEVDDPEQCSLTLRPWLQPEAGTSTAVQSPEAVITNVLLSMNREESDNQEQHLGDQCKTPDPLQQQYQNAQTKQDLEERCATWATVKNNNKYETIFQLRGPRTIEAMRYNFLTMAPATCIDIQMTKMFDTYGTNYLEKKTKMPYRVELLKDHAEYMELLDRDKLKSHSALFAPVVFSNHWWLYVLDVDNKEFYIINSVYGITLNQQRSKLHRFTCNILNQLRVWVEAQSILKKGTISLQLRCVEVPKQPNPTNCGVFVMKWMELLDAATLSGCYEFKVRYNLEEWGQDKLDGFRREMLQS